MSPTQGRKQRDPLITDHIVAVEKLTEIAKVHNLSFISYVHPFFHPADSGQLCASNDFGVGY